MHLYKRLCPSVRGSMGPCVRGSIRHAFLKYRGNEDFKTIKHWGTQRNAFLVEIQENSAKSAGRIVVRIKLVFKHLLPEDQILRKIRTIWLNLSI